MKTPVYKGTASLRPKCGVFIRHSAAWERESLGKVVPPSRLYNVDRWFQPNPRRGLRGTHRAMIPCDGAVDSH